MPDAVLIFDTETTTNAIQRLNFGWARIGYDYGGGFRCHTEICFYADDLPKRNPRGFDKLRRYAMTHKPDTDQGEIRIPAILFYSRTEFVNKWLWPLAYKKRGIVAGFNLPFDLSRIAIHAGAARGYYDGGFSLQIWGDKRPRICYKSIDSKKAFIGFTRINTPEGRDGYRGRFLDLRTLTHALTGTSHSLASACEAYGISDGKMAVAEHGVITDTYIDYARQDVKATAELYSRAVESARAHDINTPPERLFSPASVAKAYYRRMGITPPASRMPEDKELMGMVWATFFGGRAECGIRHVPVPVQVVDFTSMYPTVNALMGGWKLLTSEQIRAIDDTEPFRLMLNTITLADCFKPHVWRDFTGVALIKPDGDILPVRAQYQGNQWGLGVNRLTYPDGALWYTYPDLIASVIRTGRVPEVIQAVRFIGGDQLDMSPVMLPHSTHALDPRGDMFRAVVDQRQDLKGTPAGDFLKVFANSGSYGIFAEIIRTREREPALMDVHSSGEHFTIRTHNREDHGEYTFPPLAACITGAARLMLAMLHVTVSEAGGTWAFCDTDSTAIVCDPRTERVYYKDDRGRTGNIPVLHPEQVRRIRERFNALNPYGGVADLLKLEYTGQCYAISAKRYALFHMDRREGIVIDKASNHGLGHLLNPTDPTSDDRDWISQLWRHIITGCKAFKPDWLRKPALSRYTITTPSMLASFDPGGDYGKSMKPANFILIAHPTKTARAFHGGPLALFAPYETDPNKWERLSWINKYDGRRFAIGRASGFGDGYCQIQTYGDVLRDYVTHPEAAFNDRCGNPCGPATIGELHPCTIRPTDRVFLGKEANRLDDSLVGFATADDVCAAYGAESDAWEFWGPLVLPVLARWDVAAVRQLLPDGVGRHGLARVLGGAQVPTRPQWQALVRLAARTAGEDLDIPARRRDDVLATLTAWNDRYRSRSGTGYGVTVESR